MKESIWRKDGMKQIIDTGCKEFDRYIVSVSPGNVIGGGQYSSYIRPYNETQCNGLVNEPGHLRNYDFRGFSNLPGHVRKYVESVTKDTSVILYEFYHYNRNYHSGGRRNSYHSKYTVHGYVVTTTHAEYKLLRYFVTGPTYKSYNVILGVIPYITNENKESCND